MRLDIRHLRHFIAVAEEEHFGRAAGKLHKTQPSLSLTIRELEEDLGVALFERTTRNTNITHAGQLFLDEARRVLAALEQARATVRTVAQGYQGYLRVAIADALAQPRLAELFALQRQEEPDVELRITEMPVAELILALQRDAVDAGFTLFSEEGEGYRVEPVWHDQAAVAMLARHPLMARKRVPLSEALKYPLILAHPEMCKGGYEYVQAMLGKAEVKPVVAARVSGHESMMTLIGSGIGIGFAIDAQIAQYHRTDVAVRPLEAGMPPVVTYLLQAVRKTPSAALERFMDRARRVGGLGQPEPSKFKDTLQ